MKILSKLPLCLTLTGVALVLSTSTTSAQLQKVYGYHKKTGKGGAGQVMPHAPGYAPAPPPPSLPGGYGDPDMPVPVIPDQGQAPPSPPDQLTAPEAPDASETLETPQAPETPEAAETLDAPAAPEAPSFDAPIDAGDGFADPSGFAGGATANVGGGLNTPMLGRADANNRMNVFDNMTAAPQNRVWFAYQSVGDFNTSVVRADSNGGPAPIIPDGSAEEAFLTPRNESLYRYGFEYAIDCDTSIAYQAQYQAFGSNEFIPDDWSNPLVVGKRVLYRDGLQTTSAVLGLQYQIGHRALSVVDTHSRIYPGLLTTQQLSDRWVGQGGVQYGIPLEGGNVYTLDWALSLGYWYYRDNCGCSSMQGVVARMEILGRSAIGDEDFEGFRDPNDVLDTGLIQFQEPDDVIDVTFGLQFILRNGAAIGVASSTPISGDVVRESEFIATMNLPF